LCCGIVLSNVNKICKGGKKKQISTGLEGYGYERKKKKQKYGGNRRGKTRISFKRAVRRGRRRNVEGTTTAESNELRLAWGQGKPRNSSRARKLVPENLRKREGFMTPASGG